MDRKKKKVKGAMDVLCVFCLVIGLFAFFVSIPLSIVLYYETETDLDLSEAYFSLILGPFAVIHTVSSVMLLFSRIKYGPPKHTTETNDNSERFDRKPPRISGSRPPSVLSSGNSELFQPQNSFVYDQAIDELSDDDGLIPKLEQDNNIHQRIKYFKVKQRWRIYYLFTVRILSFVLGFCFALIPCFIRLGNGQNFFGKDYHSTSVIIIIANFLVSIFNFVFIPLHCGVILSYLLKLSKREIQILHYTLIDENTLHKWVRDISSIQLQCNEIQKRWTVSMTTLVLQTLISLIVVFVTSIMHSVNSDYKDAAWIQLLAMAVYGVVCVLPLLLLSAAVNTKLEGIIKNMELYQLQCFAIGRQNLLTSIEFQNVMTVLQKMTRGINIYSISLTYSKSLILIALIFTNIVAIALDKLVYS